MRRRQHRQRGDPVWVPAGRPPGLVAAPVTTDDVSSGKARGVEQRNDVGGSRCRPIVPAFGWVARLGCNRADSGQRTKAFRVQAARDGLEAGRVLREPVQQYDRRRIRRSSVRNVEPQPRAYEVVHWSSFNRCSAVVRLELCIASLRSA